MKDDVDKYIEALPEGLTKFFFKDNANTIRKMVGQFTLSIEEIRRSVTLCNGASFKPARRKRNWVHGRNGRLRQS